MSDVTIAPTAIVAETATLGEGTVVWHGAQVMHGVKMGVHCSVGSYAEIGRDSILGDNVRIGFGAFLPNRSRIGNAVFIGPGAKFADDKLPIAGNRPFYRPQPPIVENFVSVGMNATILPGLRLGEGCIVGAGAVVTKDVKPFSTVAGNPAKELPKP